MAADDSGSSAYCNIDGLGSCTGSRDGDSIGAIGDDLPSWNQKTVLDSRVPGSAKNRVVPAKEFVITRSFLLKN